MVFLWFSYGFPQVAVFSMPIITAVDRLVGSRNAMRIDARSAKSGEEVTLRVTHEDLEELGEILGQSWENHRKTIGKP